MKNAVIALWFILVALLVLSVVPMAAQSMPTTVTGNIDAETPFVQIPMIVAETGSTIIIDILPTSGNLDTLLYLVDSTGAIVAENDDRTPDDLSSRIEYLQAEAGDYTIIATRFGVLDGASSGDFELNYQVTLPSETTQLAYAVSDEDLLAAGFPAITPHEEAEWTVIAYYGGDTNLEDGILTDFNEFELAGGSNEATRLIMMVDRHPEYTDTSGDWDTVRIFEVGPDISGDEGGEIPPTIDTEALADLGELDTGDGETFAQYLVWAVRSYPARHYAIALGGHGAGWAGLVIDDTNGHDILRLQELKQAFAIAAEAAGVEKFDLLVNDACLMSSIEYHQAMSGYFHFSFASPEIVINPALDMTLLAETLNENASIDLVELGSTLADTYIIRDMQTRGGVEARYVTSAVTRLDEFGVVVEAVDRFADLIKSDPDTFGTLLGEARSNTYAYSSIVGNDELIDLGNLMRQIIFLSTNPDVVLAAENVLRALDEVVAYANAGDQVATQTTTYHSIYFPTQSEGFKSSYLLDGENLVWATMLRSYYNVVTPQVWSVSPTGIPFHPPIAPKIRIASVYPDTPISLLSPLSISLEIVGRNISYVDSTIDQVLLDGTVVRLLNQRLLRPVGRGGEVVRINDWASGIEAVDYVWDAVLPLVTDGETSQNELLIMTEDVASLEGQYREPNGETWNTVSLIFDRETGQFEQVINRAENDALGVVSIPTDSEFQTFRSIVSADGRVTVEPGTTYIWPEGGLSWSWQPAPRGEYNIGVLVTAFGGTTGFESTMVSLDNTGIDPSLRAVIRTNMGFSLARPESWTPLAFFRNDAVFRTLSEDGSENFTVYYSFDAPEDLGEITNLITENYGLTVAGEPGSIELPEGMPVLEFAFVREMEDGTTYSGRAFTVYVESRTFGLVFAAETTGDPADLDDLYPILRDTIILFDPVAFAEANTRQWGAGEAVENTRYPLPKTWSLVEGTDEIWARHTPDGTADNPVFVALAAFEDTGEAPEEVAVNILAEYVVDELTEWTMVENRVFTGENLVWQVAIYTGLRDGEPVQGRVYLSFLNQMVYVVWVETPDLEEVRTVITDVFEPIIDGFVIYEVEPEQEEAVVEIDAASTEEPAVLLRYDRRSLVLYNRWPDGNPIDISELYFVQIASGDPVIFRAEEWEFGDLTSFNPGDCYQLWMSFYYDIPASEFPSDICRSRQGFFTTSRSFWLSETPGTVFEVRRGDQTLATCETVPIITGEEFNAGEVDFGDEIRCLVDLGTEN